MKNSGEDVAFVGNALAIFDVGIKNTGRRRGAPRKGILGS